MSDRGRVRTERGSKRVRVMLGGEMVADTTRPLLVWEVPYFPSYYLPREDVWQTGLHNPDFTAFAELCGARGFRVTHPDQLVDAVESGVAHPGPALVGIISDPLLV